MPDFCRRHGKRISTRYCKLPDGSFGCPDCYNVKKMLGEKKNES